MSSTTRVLAPVLSLAAGLALSATGAAVAAHGTSGPAGAKSAAAGPRVSITSGVDLQGTDVLTTHDGTTYVGWVSSSYTDDTLRQVHLCVLPVGARSCAGGVQTTDSFGSASAADLHVVNDGGVPTLVWIAEPDGATGDFGDVFGVATVTNGVLGTPTAVPGAPTYGELYSAIPHPGGGISVAAIGTSAHDQDVYYYPTLGAQPATVHAPYYVGEAQLADNGSQTVLTTSAYGSLGDRVSVTSKASSAASFGALKQIPHTYTFGDGGEKLQTVGSHIWMLAMSTKELYTPYTYRWNGHAFGAPVSTGDKGEFSSVDLNTDASGRLAAVTQEVDGMVVSNIPNKGKPSQSSLTFKGTFAGNIPQISTMPSGRGWVTYSYEVTGHDGQYLVAQPIALPGLTRTVHAHGKAGSLTLTGPATCVPVRAVRTELTAKAKHGWKVGGKQLKLGHKTVHGSVNGATLKPSHHYTLKAKVIFRNGSKHTVLTKGLSFTACPRP